MDNCPKIILLFWSSVQPAIAVYHKILKLYIKCQSLTRNDMIPTLNQKTKQEANWEGYTGGNNTQNNKDRICI